MAILSRLARLDPSSRQGRGTVAKAKGWQRGKQPKLSPRQEAHLVKLHTSGGPVRRKTGIAVDFSRWRSQCQRFEDRQTKLSRCIYH